MLDWRRLQNVFKTCSVRLHQVCWEVMKYKRYICILNWKARNQKYKTIFSKQIKSEVVIMWFTYVFVNIDAQITFGNCSELLLYIFFEFNKVSLFLYVLEMNSKHTDLSFWNFYHHFWLFYERLLLYYLIYVFAILFYQIFFQLNQDLFFSKSWKSLISKCSKTFYFHCAHAWFLKKSFVIPIKISA